MLVNLKELHGSAVNGMDGYVGEIKDVYFDDRFWTIRYLVIDTHPWLPVSEKVLISPIALLNFNADDRLLNISLTKEMIENCPKVEEHETVSREFEKFYFDYFGYAYYWMDTDTWGEYAYPTALSTPDMLSFDSASEKDIEQTNHLQSSNEVSHYSVHAVGDDKGYVKDFIWDTESWSLCYLVIDTRDWLPGGKKVLISTEQLESIDWEYKTITCNTSMSQIRACPEYCLDKLNDLEYLALIKVKLQVGP
jgi:uncharacterized protein YrrD